MRNSVIDYGALERRLSAELGASGVSRRALDRYALAHDASHYLLVPELVATPRDAAQVAAVLRACDDAGVPLTFRSGGTSLSGQALSRTVLVDTRRHFEGVCVLNDGMQVTVAPGVTVRMVNARLAPYRRKLGPDPASEGACTIGGVVANNSSGMHCGTEFNTYATLTSMVLILPSGTMIDSAQADADERLRTLEPDLYAGLLQLRDRVRDNPESVATLRRLFAMKNTMGYGLNSFLDHERAVDILVHLMIGSEGTLGFCASATFATVPVKAHIASTLAVLPTIGAAAEAVPALVQAGSATAELLDAASLRISAGDPACPAIIADLDVSDHAALLLEWTADTPDELAQKLHTARTALSMLDLTRPAELTSDAAERAALWRVRKGLFSAVAEARPGGTNALLEDVVVRPDVLGQACVDLTELFAQHDYPESVIFGHAKDGNVHFLLNERFGNQEAMQRYQDFTEDLVDLVLGHGGSLKAEHGTGRMMAPFVRRQYGDELYAVMWALKRLIDPRGLLNPESVLCDEPESYLRDLKIAPEVEQEVGRCVECGYCEPVCPSRQLTLTPRQRITLRRDMVAARERGEVELAAELERDYDYAGLQTCAVDGMCLSACPVRINTGDLVRRLRAESAPPALDAVWALAAHGWRVVPPAASAALTMAQLVPSGLPGSVTTVGRRLLGADMVPMYDAALPSGGGARVQAGDNSPVAVLFSACIGTMFGPQVAGGTQAAGALLALARRAGLGMHSPHGLPAMCCGTPWKSKGLSTGYAVMAQRVLPALWEGSEHGRLPIVCEASSCTEGLAVMIEGASDRRYAEMRVIDGVAWVAREVLPRLQVTQRVAGIVVHPTCSSTANGSTSDLVALAQAMSEQVDVPDAWGCCGFAGDRGLLHPELTAAATAPEAAEVAAVAAVSDIGDRGRDPAPDTAYVSCNRTCEIGMTRATGRPYQHILSVLEDAMASPPPG